MDFRAPAEAEAFRKEFRAWLEANLSPDLVGDGLGGGSMEIGGDRLERLRTWNRSLADARYAAIAWPEEWGGRGAGVMEQVVYSEEMHRARAPGTLNPLGLSNIAPAIIEHGTDEQKRDLLPRMLRGDDIWCQGFSEPNAGSDLASLRTKAVLDGDTWIVNGQKTWNTLGHMSNWCELLVRTDPDVPKHKGITCLLVDEARTTPLGDGRMATDDPVLREKLAATYLDGELLKLISDRALSAELHGRAMGPEGSIAKLLWSETEQHVTELASEVFGPDALTG